MVEMTSGTSWRAMVPELAISVAGTFSSPFDTGIVLVDSPASGRLLLQELAQIDGIAAGVEALTLSQWLRRQAIAAGIEEHWSAWHSSRLVTTIWEALAPLAEAHPLLQRYLARPGRRFTAATRFASLLRSYLRHSPEHVAQWPQALSPEQAWQPELWRIVVDELGFDPSTFPAQIAAAAGGEAIPTWAFCLGEVPAAWQDAIDATPFVGRWEIEDAPAPRVELHGSHSRLRQAEVLRDALTHAFANDPALEPRDVRIVCPEPEIWGPVLNAVFRTPAAHPGTELRVAEVAPAVGGNLVLDALLTALDVLDDRATVTQVVELLGMPAIAHRWDFESARDDITELATSAQIRWGLDEQDRLRHGLPNHPHNTWLAGIDALLTGAAMGPHIGPSNLAGVEEIGTNDLTLVGNLAEIIHRLVRLRSDTASPLPVQEWARLLIHWIDELFGLDWDDAWMLRQASAVLARIEREHAGGKVHLSRREFRRLLALELPSRTHRPAIGNGGLHVVAPDDARYVDARVVAFIGIDDAPSGVVPDAIPGWLPDAAAERHRALSTHARAAEKLIIVTRAFSERTGAPVERPVPIEQLTTELGVRAQLKFHAPQPFNPSAFDESSFDSSAHAGATATGVQPDPVEARRHTALRLPVGPPEQTLALEDIERTLKKPVTTFLRAAAGMQWLSEHQLVDNLPLALDSLEKWQIGTAFINGVLAAEDPVKLMRRQRARQVVPPGQLGDSMISNLGRQMQKVADAALPLLDGKHELHTLSLDLDGTQITGNIRLHGGRLVIPSASRNRNALLLPWLQVLLLAAHEIPADAMIIRPKATDATRITTLRQPSPEMAREYLSHFLQAHLHAQYRLVPAQWDAVSGLAIEQRFNANARDAWIRPEPFDWPKWRPESLWSVFYADPATGILHDPPLADDAPSEFEAWVSRLGQPFVQHGGTW